MINFDMAKQRIKQWYFRKTCKHLNADVVKWCISNIANRKKTCIVVHYTCFDCGKDFFIYLKGDDFSQWIKMMGGYKYEDFYIDK